MKKDNYFKKILSNKVMIIGVFSFILLVVFSFLLYGKGTYSASETGKCFDCSKGGGDSRVFVPKSDPFYDNERQGCNLISSNYTESQCLDASTSSHIVRLSPGEGQWSDGSGQPKDYEFTTDTISAMAPVKAFGLSRDGYEFDGWSPSEIDTSLPDIPKNGTITSEYFAADREPLMAKWKKVTKHIVDVSPGERRWKDGSRQTKVYEFTTDTISAMEPFNAFEFDEGDCQFDGWKTGVDTSLPDIPKNGTITSKYFAPNDVLVAKWNCDSPPSTRIIVSFFASNGTTLLSKKYCDSGTCYGIDLPIPNINKCSSDKWCLGESSDCDSPIPSETITMSLYTKTTRYTCFAKDSSIPSKKYSIKFYDYYGHILFSDQTCTATLNGNTICELGSFNIPEKECGSWCTKSNGCDDSVTNANLANLPVDSNKSFYCAGPIPYEVKMNLNNGKSSLTTETIIPVSYYEKITFDDMYESYLGDVTREGYTLSGWCYDSNCSSTVLHQFVDYKENGKTLYAKWDEVFTPSPEPDIPGEEAPFDDIIDGDMCYNGTIVKVSVCQAKSISGAECKTSKGVVLRSKLTSKDNCSETDVPSNPGTGTTMIVVSWIIGVVALVVSFYYFKENKFVKK